MTSSSNAVGGAGEHASGAIGGATEHASGRIAMASDPQKMTLEDAIVTLEAHGDLDDRGANILAAAITLRDSTGHDRKAALRSMCRAWSVDRQEKIDGKWKDRGMAELENLLSEAVCMAAARWQSNLHGQTEQRGVPEHASLETAQYDALSVGEEVQERGVAEDSAETCLVCNDPDDGDRSVKRCPACGESWTTNSHRATGNWITLVSRLCHRSESAGAPQPGAGVGEEEVEVCVSAEETRRRNGGNSGGNSW